MMNFGCDGVCWESVNIYFHTNRLNEPYSGCIEKYGDAQQDAKEKSRELSFGEWNVVN